MWICKLFACFPILLAMSLFALAEDSRWAKAIDVEGSATINSVEQTFDGGFVAVGTASDDSPDKTLFIQLDSSGKLQWAKTYGSGTHSYMTLQASDGGFVFAGRVRRNALVVKLDAAGGILWQKSYATSASSEGAQFESRDIHEARSIIQAADGGFFVLGNSTRSNQKDVWCMKLRSNGTIKWQKRYGAATSDDEFSHAIGTNDGGLIFVGGTNEIKDGGKLNELPWVVKLNQHGSIVWQKVYSSENSGFAMASAITATVDGGYVVGCTSTEGWAIKIKADGSLSWQTAFHYGSLMTKVRVSSVRQERDGHILLMGTSGFMPWPMSYVVGHIWTARLDSQGKMFWHTGFGKATDPGGDYVSAIHDTPSDGTVFVGRWYTGTGVNGLVAQTSSNGLTCRGFREPIQLSSYESSLKAQTAYLEIKKNDFWMQDAHLKQAPASVKIVNLCSK